MPNAETLTTNHAFQAQSEASHRIRLLDSKKQFEAKLKQCQDEQALIELELEEIAAQLKAGTASRPTEARPV